VAAPVAGKAIVVTIKDADCGAAELSFDSKDCWVADEMFRVCEIAMQKVHQ